MAAGISFGAPGRPRPDRAVPDDVGAGARAGDDTVSATASAGRPAAPLGGGVEGRVGATRRRRLDQAQRVRGRAQAARRRGLPRSSRVQELDLPDHGEVALPKLPGGDGLVVVDVLVPPLYAEGRARGCARDEGDTPGRSRSGRRHVAVAKEAFLLVRWSAAWTVPGSPRARGGAQLPHHLVVGLEQVPDRGDQRREAYSWVPRVTKIRRGAPRPGPVPPRSRRRRTPRGTNGAGPSAGLGVEVTPGPARGSAPTATEVDPRSRLDVVAGTPSRRARSMNGTAEAAPVLTTRRCRAPEQPPGQP